jgi:hypothetical protein
MGFDFPLNDWIREEHIEFLRTETDLFETAMLKNRIIFSLVALTLWRDVNADGQ